MFKKVCVASLVLSVLLSGCSNNTQNVSTSNTYSAENTPVPTTVLQSTEYNTWLVDYFSHKTTNKLTDNQINLIKDSAVVTSAAAENAGVKITLVSVTGDGYCSYYKLDVVLPEGMDAGDGYNFEKEELLINDESIGLGTLEASCTTLDDGDQTDNRFSVLLSTRLTNYKANRNYSFNNGIIRTLHLENIVDGSNPNQAIIQGQWDFGIIFKNEAKNYEFIKEPVTVSGYSFWDKKYFEVKITSFVLSDFGAYCEFEKAPNSQSAFAWPNFAVIMKDGSSYQLVSEGGGDLYSYYYLNVPVPLDEVDYVRLSNNIILYVNVT